jgi:sugar lactone lactonase YvrE
MHMSSRLASLALALLSIVALDANAWNRGEVEKFATLPAGAPNPEGITADAHGNLYVTSFQPTGSAPGQLVVIDGRNGKVLRQVSIAGSSPALLGLAFHPITEELLVIDFGAGKVLSVDPSTGASSVFADVAAIAQKTPGLNALNFDKDGNVYISDSFGGIIWKTGLSGGAVSMWAGPADALAPTGIPPFGANGLQFNNAGDALLVANTATDSIVRIPVLVDGSAGTPEALVYSINGADGLFIDEKDNIWVCANQADEIVVIDKSGKVIAKLGDSGGVDAHGAPRGFLFPASPVKVGEWVYVTNLALDLRNVGGPQTIDSQWATQVKTHTISRVRARIPNVSQ